MTGNASDLVRLFRQTDWGRRTLAMGFGPDLAMCADVDVTQVLPRMEGGRITLGRPAPP